VLLLLVGCIVEVVNVAPIRRHNHNEVVVVLVLVSLEVKKVM